MNVKIMLDWGMVLRTVLFWCLLVDLFVNVQIVHTAQYGTVTLT